MDTKALRQKILDLAIHGKLVPQDPNDEPASVLLQRIREEKERLIKEGKIKKGKKSAKTSDTGNYPYLLPNGWEWCKLDDLAFYKKGPFGSSLTKSMFVPKSDNTYKVYEQKNAIQKDCNLGSYYITREKYETLKGFSVQPYDIIVSCAGTIGETYVLPSHIEKGIINQALMLIRLYSKEIERFYLLYFDFILKEEACKSSKGTAIKNIPPFDILKNFYFPMPPIKEQQRILDEVNKWMSLINTIESGKTSLQSAVKQAKSKILDLAIHGKLVPQDPNDEPASVLLQRINPKAQIASDNAQYENVPFDVPSSWEWCRLGMTNEIARGGSPRPIKDYLTTDENGINWIKIGDTTKNGKYINSVKERIRPEGVKKSRIVHKGDFLLTNSMSFGRPYILNVDGCIHDGWLVISPKGNAYTSDFLYYLLSSNFAYEQFAGVASGGVVTNLNSEKVADTNFPLPPLPEQRRIVSKIEELFARLDRIEAEL